MTPSKLFKDFFNSEKSGGFVLISCTIISLLLANFIIGSSYTDFWHQKLGFSNGSIQLKLSIEHWINDGLMAVFFLLIGLEIERELYAGELSSMKNAALPVFAAIGGMAVPALIYIVFTYGTTEQSGFGIPMATDIAFSLGVLSLAGKHIPLPLKIFLTALAIIDDLGAIIIIAIFYTSNLQLPFLLAALGIFTGLILLNRLKVHSLWPYLLGGLVMWYCMLQSGVHATLAGVLLAFAIPFGDGKEKSPSYILQHILHKPVAFLIVPLFALANTGVVITGDADDILFSGASLGIILGLVLGKPIGILLFSWLAVKTKAARIPEGVAWRHLGGAAVLAGIGFTMSIFITLLAFRDAALLNHSKVAILVASVVAGVTGFTILSKR